MSREAPMDTPLMPERIREGDVTAIHAFDRHDASVQERDNDMWSPTYLKPLMYTLHPTRGGTPMLVHESRIIRFDGLAPAVAERLDRVRAGLGHLAADPRDHHDHARTSTRFRDQPPVAGSVDPDHGDQRDYARQRQASSRTK